MEEEIESLRRELEEIKLNTRKMKEIRTLSKEGGVPDLTTLR